MNPQTKRDLWLDMIRGLSLVIMTIDHLPDSPLSHITFEPLGFFSAAHIFFFLSGWINGSQLGRVQAEEGSDAVRWIVRQRVSKIFVWHVFTVLLTAIFVTAGHTEVWRTAFPLFAQKPLMAVLAASALIHLPGLFCILPCYFWFFTLVPLVLAQVNAGRTRLVVSASAALWLLAQFNVFTPPADPAKLYVSQFNLAGWQAMFFSGLLLGQYFRTRTFRLPPLPTLVCGIAATFLFCWHHNGSFEWLLSSLHFPVNFPGVRAATDINRLGWLGLLNFALIVLLATHVTRTVKTRIAFTKAGRALTLLGQHSLQVFVWHMLLWLALLPSEHYIETVVHPIIRTLVSSSAAATLLIPALLSAKYRERQKRNRQRPIQVSVPAASRAP
jgi:hypothetical protein